ncbi:DASH family cryptochrome [Rheinheimera baltica]|uniref:DASH family cryptochrome n=1 Tax=Rheinheimera baltica TaxID=67576 RepID=UPI00273E4F08|nr:DASH family cryptochrome [Rheinheimera baltica]MDP5141929.1 DASH family cryptochrome [Rheinheimera baltica]
MSLNIILLNETLRWHDNPLLQLEVGPKVAVLVLDEKAFFASQYGVARANLRRLQQQLEAIAALKRQLASQHIGLIVCVGNIKECIRRLQQQLGATSLYAAEPVGFNEYSALQQLKPYLSVTLLDCNSLLGDGLRPQLDSLPNTFTPFRKQREPLLEVSAPSDHSVSSSAWLSIAQCEVFNPPFNQLYHQYAATDKNFSALEQSATTHFTQYIWQQQHVRHYKETRNQLYGEHYASFLSAPLALGTLSVRWAWQQIIAFEHSVTANDSTYWLKFELLWREFFRWQFRKYGARWFSKGAIKGAIDFNKPKLNAAQLKRFENWCQASTGVPFIDANMRLLNQTGLMSNRGRQNVASFLVHDLGVDWRLGAAYFEQRLLDYDCASNWGNWAYIAGSGNAAERQFNVIKQALHYDPDGSFVRAMLPEITLSGSLAHQPSQQFQSPEHWHHWLAKLQPASSTP